ncbi:MAG: hypothetical protein R3B70_42450 [Polyangiaceae bacterium]
MSRLSLAAALVFLLPACGSSGSGEGTTGGAAAPPAGSSAAAATTSAAAAPANTGAAAAPSPGGGGMEGAGTVDGAKAVVAALQAAADQGAEARKLQPGTEELKALFSDAAAADAVAKQTAEMLSRPSDGAFPKGDAAVFCASSDDVKAWTDDVQKNFPGGYKRLGPKLNGGLTMCKFKVGGKAYDALVHINGKWYFVPKPFRAVKE